VKTNKIHSKNKVALEHASGLTLKELAAIASRAEEKLAAWGVSAPGAIVWEKGVIVRCEEKGWHYVRQSNSVFYYLCLTRQQEDELQEQYTVYANV
jgi:hypothetical protein